MSWQLPWGNDVWCVHYGVCVMCGVCIMVCALWCVCDVWGVHYGV